MLLAAKRGEYSLAFLAGEDRAPRAYHAGRVQILRMVLDVEQNHLLRDAVEDVLRARRRNARKGALRGPAPWAGGSGSVSGRCGRCSDAHV